MRVIRIAVGADGVTLETAIRRAVRYARKGMDDCIRRAPDDLGVWQDAQRWAEEYLRGAVGVIAREIYTHGPVETTPRVRP